MSYTYMEIYYEGKSGYKIFRLSVFKKFNSFIATTTETKHYKRREQKFSSEGKLLHPLLSQCFIDLHISKDQFNLKKQLLAIYLHVIYSLALVKYFVVTVIPVNSFLKLRWIENTETSVKSLIEQ